MPRAKNSDDDKLNILLMEIASDSLKRKESKEQYKERLMNLRDQLDIAIEAAD